MTAVLVAGAAVYLAAFAAAMQNRTYDYWGAFLIAPVLFALSLPILRRFAKHEPHPWIFRLLVTALVLKFLAGYVRYQVAFVGYDGAADAPRFHHSGTLLAQQFRHMDFSLTSMSAQHVIGTGFLEILTGIVYAITGPTLLGGYLVFSWLGFWGLFLFYRAFRLAVPDGEARRYATLLFLLPSMLFWPSGIGKESWMMLSLGASAYGAALLLTGRRGAVLWLVAGLAATIAVRPHVTLVVVAGVAIAYALRGRQAAGVSASGPLRKIVGLTFIAAATMFVLAQSAKFFGVEDLNADSANQVFDNVAVNTAQGGSAYQGSGGPSLTNMPMNLVTVLFRPWPFEAHNTFALISAFEGTLLLLVLLASLPRLKTIPARLRSQPYVVLCIIETLLFCFMFSTFHNFGILTRERVQVYPFALVLLALPVTHRSDARRTAVRGRGVDRRATEASPGAIRDRVR